MIVANLIQNEKMLSQRVDRVVPQHQCVDNGFGDGPAVHHVEATLAHTHMLERLVHHPLDRAGFRALGTQEVDIFCVRCQLKGVLEVSPRLAHRPR